MNSKRYTQITLYLIAIIFSTTRIIFARSVYVISDTEASKMQAYKVEDANLVYQIDYHFVSETWGPVGIAIDESEHGEYLFVTFEGDNIIELVNAKTMEYVDVATTPGATNLSGIEMNMSKNKLYAVNRYTNHLYSYSWNPATKILTPDFNDPYYIELEGLVYGIPKGAFGIALDEENDLLYVADNTDEIKYYDTNDWSHDPNTDYITVSCNVISIAIDVNNQLLYYGSMGSYGQGDQIEEQATAENLQSHGDGAVGLALDPDSEMLFVTYEGSNIIEIMNAKTMEYVDTITALNATNRTGIDLNAAGKCLNEALNFGIMNNKAMKARITRGRENKIRKTVLPALFILIISTCHISAATWWDSGHHVINDEDAYGEVFLQNDASVDVFGGTILQLKTLDLSTANIFGGEMDRLYTFDNSVVNIYGGNLDWLGAFPDSVVYLYAYDVTYHLTGGLENRPWAEGTYYSDSTSFSFTLYDEYGFSHVVVIPEPISFLLFGFGALFLRKRN
ncbi:MAG: hypothetical protein ACYS9C_19540 [Planctomycetota bacterium]